MPNQHAKYFGGNNAPNFHLVTFIPVEQKFELAEMSNNITQVQMYQRQLKAPK